MKKLLNRVDDIYILLTFGFVRSIGLEDVPVEIMNYCILYAFLRMNEWFTGGVQWNIDESKYITYGDNKDGKTSTIHANPVISRGKHTWKIKITAISDDHSEFASFVNIEISTSIIV